MRELVDEQRRDRAEAAAREIEIGRLDGLVRDQAVAKFEQQAPVLARVDVRDRGDLGLGDRPARFGEERRVERALDHTRLRGRLELRPRQIGLEELVGHDEPAAVVAVEQMMAAGEPEILHAITPGVLVSYCRRSSP